MPTQNDDEIEIDLREVLYVLLNKSVILLVSLLAGAILALGMTRYMITPQYTASSMIYIFTKTTSITSLADLQMGSQLTVDFQILGTSRPVVESVIKKLNLNATYEELVDSSITITNPATSRILKISVENPDPQLAADISNAMAQALSDRVAEVLNTDKPSIVEDAVTPINRTTPNTRTNVLVGAIIGFMIAATIILVRYFMDDTIKSEDHVKKYLGLNTLAAIPYRHQVVEKKKKKFFLRGLSGHKKDSEDESTRLSFKKKGRKI